MSAPWSDFPNTADTVVHAAPTLGLVHELSTLVSTLQTVTGRILEVEAEITANRADFENQPNAAVVELIDRTLAAMELALPVTTVMP